MVLCDDVWLTTTFGPVTGCFHVTMRSDVGSSCLMIMKIMSSRHQHANKNEKIEDRVWAGGGSGIGGMILVM